MAKIDQTSSMRLMVLRWPLIVGVVYIHYSGAAVSDETTLTSVIQDVVKNGFARVAVPLFFLMSGFFFFLGLKGTPAEFKAKFISRAKTLLIPFLFWNVLVFSMFYVFQSLPATKPLFSGNNAGITNCGFLEAINCIFGITHNPAAYQFWFVRDLMVLVLLSPLLYFLFRYVWAIVMLAAVGGWLLHMWPISIPTSQATCFFCLGAFFAFKKWSFFKMDRFGPFIVIAYLISMGVAVAMSGHQAQPYIHRFSIILGVASALYVTKFIINWSRLRDALIKFSACSFFIYAVHEPALTALCRITYRLIEPKSGAMVLTLFFVLPIVIIAMAMIGYKILKRLVPRLLMLVTGGR